MKRSHRLLLAGGALVLALAGMALGKSAVNEAPPELSSLPPATIGAFELARVLSEAPPDVVVVAFDHARHPVRGALPVTLFGADDAAFVEHAPEARSLVLVARDPVRADRVARRLMADGRSVRVLDGGIEAWDRAMGADPPAPRAGANGEAWQRYRSELALRHAFGDPGLAPAAPLAAPAAPLLAPAAAPVKKREGC
jgi:rhodanese-related sulfurtransferase